MRSLLLTLAVASVLANAFELPLPFKTLNCHNYPKLDTPVDENPEWTALYDLTNVPDIPPNVYINENKENVDICQQHLPDACNAECECRRNEPYNCKRERHWALTFDWAPTCFTPDLVQNLQEAGGVKATFFVSGSRLCDLDASEIINIVNEGHEIGIGPWEYTRLSALSNGQIIAQIKWTENALFELTGIKSKYFRPPVRNMDDRVRFIIEAMGYTPILWTSGADTLDWKYVQETPMFKIEEGTEFITGNVQKYISSVNGRPGTISVQQNLGEIPTSATKDVIKTVRHAGWKLVPMTKCLKDTSFAQNGIIVAPKPDFVTKLSNSVYDAMTAFVGHDCI